MTVLSIREETQEHPSGARCLMNRLLCLLGRHDWEHQRNPDVGGAGAAFDVCRRCHKEKPVYGGLPGKGFPLG